jgi:hypothetical protein
LLESILSVRPYLELAYFSAGVLLLFGLVITFFQLLLIKNDIRLRNERASKERAIEAASRYLKDYVSALSAHNQNTQEKELDSYSGPIGDFTLKSLPAPMLERALERFGSDSILPALNELEAIAAYFTTGVADEQTGFRIIGRTFCHSVEDYYDIIACCRTEKAQPYWYNIVRLYRMWRPRLTKAEMRTAIQDLESKMRAVGLDNAVDSIDREKL